MARQSKHKQFERSIVGILRERMSEPRHAMQVVVGPRQTGKTTAVRQAMDGIDKPVRFVRVSQDILTTREWLRREWGEARRLAAKEPTIFVVDEIQMVPQWSSVVKALWDEDTDSSLPLQVILTGSSSLLLQKGLRESLAGRFELIRCLQWDFAEMEEAFGYTLDEYLYFGGYPGSAAYKKDPNRWLDYMQNSIIAPSVFKDVIVLERVNRPELMEALFTLGCAYSGQELSYRKILGQLDDSGNVSTIARYLTLLGDAGMLQGISKYAEKLLKTRASSPKFMVFDTSLMVASYGRRRSELLSDPERRGRLVESAVGAYLLRHGLADHFDVNWWRDGNDEVDFVIHDGEACTAIEAKGGSVKALDGLNRFIAEHPDAHSVVVGSANASLEAFLQGDIPLF